MSENLSPNQKAMRRLLRNKPALFGLVVIAFAILVALLGYVIAPDATPDANDQMPMVALKDPGFKVKILKIRKNREIKQSNWFSKLLFGAPSEFDFVPINQVHFVQDSTTAQDMLEFEKYAGENPETGQLLRGVSNRVHPVDIIFAVNPDNPKISSLGSNYQFFDLINQLQTIDIQQTNKQAESQVFEKVFYLGTDNFGRDTLSRLILGVRISLLVGLIAVIISLTIGILLGALAGYFGGRVDDVIMLIINTIWSIPTILLVFAIVLAFGRGIGIIFLAVGLTMWVDVARLVRGQVMLLKEIQFVEAAQSMGFNTSRILLRHILPNILGPVMVVAASNFATAILIESGLSYLGFGIQPPTPSWGTMLNENYGYAIGGKPMLALIPAIAIMLMVLAFNLVGNGFRDALDVKSKE
ncbi:MAG: ABC transporter permease [Saprospiraceae bacterium]|nr:ABC transporter permease [Saprospiraceae bacterium]